MGNGRDDGEDGEDGDENDDNIGGGGGMVTKSSDTNSARG